MAAIRADIVGQELCKAMGINSDNVSSFQIICEAGGAACIIVERWLDSEEVGILRKVISKYSFKEIEA